LPILLKAIVYSLLLEDFSPVTELEAAFRRGVAGISVPGTQAAT